MPTQDPLSPRHKAIHRQLLAGRKASQVAEHFGLSEPTIRRYAAAYRNAAGLTKGCRPPTGKPAAPKDRVPVIRVRYVGGGSTSVSCGEGEDYARSMVETMAMGREIASLEVVK